MSSSLPATPPPSPGTVLTLQQRRLQQILWAVMAAFGTAALMSFSKGGYTSVALELVALALLGLAYRWNQRGELARASSGSWRRARGCMTRGRWPFRPS
ncbi:MAG TPA: hypothetical protein PKN26_08110 [Giesbergeria sp.]|nr:hypothetical protein [Giesbergeria sp.]